MDYYHAYHSLYARDRLTSRLSLAGDGDVDCLPLDENTLHRLHRNDPSLLGLRIDATNSNWVEGAGIVIGNSMFLREIVLEMKQDPCGNIPTHRLEELCRGISHNRTIQTFRMVGEGHFQHLDMDIFQILTPFFEYNRRIHTVSLGHLDMSSSPAFDSLILALSTCKELKCFHVDSITCDCHENAKRLFDALSTKGLVELKLRFFHSRRPAHSLRRPSRDNEYSALNQKVGRALANLIETSANSMCALELINGHFDRHGFRYIVHALRCCKTLEHLGLIGGAYYVLDNLRYSKGHFESCINDEYVIELGDYFAGIDTLNSLDLDSSCYSITSISGWRGLVKCLRKVNSSLYSLSLQDCGMNDESAHAIVSALSGNSCLRELCLLNNARITDNIWDVILNMLCDRTSVGSIMYSSNHTLQSILIDLPIPAEVAFLLAMNRNEDRSGAIRGKLLKYHFLDKGDGDKCANIFAQMSESMMPIALEWIGRNRFGFSLMYEFVQMGPAIFDITHGQQIVNA